MVVAVVVVIIVVIVVVVVVAVIVEVVELVVLVVVVVVVVVVFDIYLKMCVSPIGHKPDRSLVVVVVVVVVVIVVVVAVRATGLASVPKTSHRSCQHIAPATRNAHPIKECRACHAKLHRKPFSRPRAGRTKAAAGRTVTSGRASSKTPGQKRCARCALAKRRTK